MGILYYGNHLSLDLPESDTNLVSIGHALFTKAGEELYTICGSKRVDGFWEYVTERWKDYSPYPAKDPWTEFNGTITMNTGATDYRN
jgi:hypothetical protein